SGPTGNWAPAPEFIPMMNTAAADVMQLHQGRVRIDVLDLANPVERTLFNELQAAAATGAPYGPLPASKFATLGASCSSTCGVPGVPLPPPEDPATIQSWGGISGMGMKVGGVLNLWSAAHVDNPYVKGVGLTAGTVETFGATLYFGGALTTETQMMALGGNIARFSGGLGLTVVSGYTFVQDVKQGNVRDAIGSGANTTAGVTMLATSNPIFLTAT